MPRFESSDSGGALPATLITLVALTGVAAAVWHAAHLELIISANHLRGVEAFYLAESGWNQYLAEHAVRTEPASRWLAFPQGSVHVEIGHLVSASPDTAIYVVTSTGYRTRIGGGLAPRRSVRLLLLEDSAGRLVTWPGTWREVW